MKLLEERTEASKNEMDRMEALEELQELNKREVKINYDEMLSKYDKLRELEAKKELENDEQFIRQVGLFLWKPVASTINKILSKITHSFVSLTVNSAPSWESSV